MVNYKIHQKIMEKMFEHTCNIYEFASVFDEESKQTFSEEILKFENLPCKLSQEISTTGNEKTVGTDEYNNISKHIKLFLQANIDIKSGAKVIVNYNDNQVIFINATEPVFYPTHTEICLSIQKDKA